MDPELAKTFGIVTSSHDGHDESNTLSHSEEILEHILHIVETFEALGEHQHAICALEALSHSKYCFSLTNVEVKVRSQLAQLYIEHEDFVKAKEHLVLAVCIRMIYFYYLDLHNISIDHLPFIRCHFVLSSSKCVGICV